MPTKKEIMTEVEESPHSNFSKSKVKVLINSIAERKSPPLKLKKGDVISINGGVKKRPCVIIKIINGVTYSIPLSTTEDELNLIPFENRFFGHGWFSRSLVTCIYSVAISQFIGVFDDNRTLNKASNELFMEFEKIFNKKL